MKYWRGYLTAGIFGFFTWMLTQFAKTHEELIDMFYPYVSRMGQDTLSAWSSAVSYPVWQVLAAVGILVVIASIVLMVILRWNPIQWFGWVLAAVSIVYFLHTGIYGLNSYAGPLADDIRLDVEEYTLSQLVDATTYYRDKANGLSTQMPRNTDGSLNFPDFDTLAAQADNGFRHLTYDDYYPVFAGDDAPVKKLGWAGFYTSSGITGVTMGLTGEAAVNPEIPAISLPFTMCHELSHRRCIALERDANFGAYLACRANDSIQFQYSGYFMAYRYCYNALVSAGGSVQAQAISSGETAELTRDLADYRTFFTQKQSAKATKVADKVNDTYIKASGDSSGVASYGEVCDLLVNLYLEEEVKPNMVEPDPTFDPLDKSQVDLGDLVGDWG